MFPKQKQTCKEDGNRIHSSADVPCAHSTTQWTWFVLALMVSLLNGILMADHAMR